MQHERSLTASSFVSRGTGPWLLQEYAKKSVSSIAPSFTAECNVIGVMSETGSTRASYPPQPLASKGALPDQKKVQIVLADFRYAHVASGRIEATQGWL